MILQITMIKEVSDDIPDGIIVEKLKEEKFVNDKCVEQLTGLTNKANPTLQDAKKCSMN